MKSDTFKGLTGIHGLLQEIAASVDSRRLGEHLKLLGEDAGHPRLKKDAARYFQWTREILERLLHEAVEAGDLNHGVNPQLLAFHLEALIQGSIFQFGFLDGGIIGKHLEKHVDYALKPYLKGKSS